MKCECVIRSHNHDKKIGCLAEGLFLVERIMSNNTQVPRERKIVCVQCVSKKDKLMGEVKYSPFMGANL